MTKLLFGGAFVLGALAILWIGRIFLGSDILGLSFTVLIGLVYAGGAWELLLFRKATFGLNNALSGLSEKVENLSEWLIKLSPSLQNAVRLRIEGERVGLPAPVITPYLVGLLVMLGLLGTFLGMVGTLNGAVLALEGDNELEAVRAGLAAPIEGLGLAFGTSVAGVAASAMLGLLSTISRRERLLASQSLDEKITQELQGFSVSHQQKLAFQAIQDQAQALPLVADKLNVLAGNLEGMADDLGQKLLQSQTSFQDAVTQSYQSLSDALSQSLQDNVKDNVELIRSSIQPMAESTLSKLNDTSLATQKQLDDINKQQLSAFHQASEKNTALLKDVFDVGLEQQSQASEAMLSNMNASVVTVSEQLQSSSQKLLDDSLETNKRIAEQQQTLHDTSLEMQEKLHGINEQQLLAFNQAVEGNGVVLREIFDAGLAQQSNASDAILAALNESAQTSSSELKSSSERLLGDFSEANQRVSDQQREQMTQFTVLMTEQLAQLRDDEGERTSAAVERIASLETRVSEHLLRLGQGLEEPMTRLIETASQTPKAAADVIEKLRAQISQNVERDNDLLDERTNLLQRLELLSNAMQENTQSQQQAISSLVDGSTSLLGDVTEKFAQHLETQSMKLSDAATHFTHGSVELASLGDAFNTAVTMFSESNDRLVANLNQIEVSLEKNSARSDEQLAYYVAQAREIIDHNVSSHKDVFDAMAKQFKTAAKAANAS